MAALDQQLAVFKEALSLRTQRHQVLASNIANADTPHYKARDFSFEAAMHNAMAGAAPLGGAPMRATAYGHMVGGMGSGFANLQFRRETQSAVDGNTVDMDVERAQMAENALQYQVLTQLISEKFKGLRAALASTNA